MGTSTKAENLQRMRDEREWWHLPRLARAIEKNGASDSQRENVGEQYYLKLGYYQPLFVFSIQQNFNKIAE